LFDHMQKGGTLRDVNMKIKEWLVKIG
jgi:hypothetical protein